jgi:ABC-2 type transport system ATP-binding protein
MIHLYGLTKTFRNKKEWNTVVDSLNIEIKRGEIFGLLGPNGAGKTTTVKVLSTLITPTSGTAVINGHDIIKSGRAVRASIGLSVGDERSFYYRLTGYQNLEFFGVLYGLSGKILKWKIDELLEWFDLKEEKHIKFMKYSSGMRKKLNLARALLCNPPIYFFDEPTSSIDPHSAVKIRSQIKELRSRGKTILLTSHNMYEVEELCDRIAIMDKGKIVVIATPGELKKRTNNSIVKIKIHGRDIPRFTSHLSQLTEVDQVLTTDNSWISVKTSEKSAFMNSIYRLVSGYQVTISDFNIEQPSLEDVFIRITGERT